MDKGTKLKGGPTSAFWKNPETVEALQQAFADDATIEQACTTAGIAPSCYYDYKSKNPEVVEQWERLSAFNQMKAKQNVLKKIREGNVKVSKWYLERKSPDFMPKTRRQYATARSENAKLQSAVTPANFSVLEQIKKEVAAQQASAVPSG